MSKAARAISGAGRLAGLAVGMALALPTDALRQSQPAERALECFVREATVQPRPCETPPDTTVIVVMLDADDHPVVLVDRIMDGLGDLALEHPESRVRIASVAWLATAGERSTTRSPEVVDRLVRIYERGSPYIRSAVVDRMQLQRARGPAIRFLESAAKGDGSSEPRADFPVPYVALNALVHMGEEGRDALRRLTASGEVRDRRARGYLRHLAENGFGEPARRR